MDVWLIQLLLIVATLALVLLNGFFVAAEFALVCWRTQPAPGSVSCST